MSRLKVVIVGRPNVGKSTLFNRLIGHRQALVHDLPGVTRDRNVAEAEWIVHGARVQVEMTDTGGLGGETFAEEIERQVRQAVLTADVVVAVFDSTVGLAELDREVVLNLKKQLSKVRTKENQPPIIGVPNKVDDLSHEERVGEFYELGLERIVGVSAEHNLGTDELKDEIFDAVAASGRPIDEFQPGYDDGGSRTPPPRIAIVGRPNAGKSTLTNRLLGEERMITSPIAGTTIDAVDSFVEIDGRTFILTDTAGIRRKSKTEQGIEVLSVVQARRALERSDVAILVLNGEEGPADQDEKIAGLIEEMGCSVILALNKWDTQEGRGRKILPGSEKDLKPQNFTREEAAKRIREQFRFLGYAPVVFMSALNGDGVEGLGELIEQILHERELKISTKEFTEWVRAESTIHNPSNAKFYLCHQVGRKPPSFVCHVNDPDKIHFSLKRHLVNAIRDRWGFMGSPVRLNFISGHTSGGERRR